MIRTFILASGVVIAAAAVAVPSYAEHPDVLAHTPARARDAAAPAASAPAAANPAAPAPAITPPAPEAAASAPAAPSPAAAVPAVTSPAPEALAPAASAPVAAASAPATPETEAMRSAISSLAPGDNDEERNERAALVSFYEARGHAPLWLTAAGGFTPPASQAAAEIRRAGDWGLDARDFALPAGLEQSGAAPSTPEVIAAAEIAISQAVLKYGRYARGGRIINPSEQLSSYLDRRPQFLKPAAILEAIATAAEPDGLSSRPAPGSSAVRETPPEISGRARARQAARRRGQAAARQYGAMALDAHRHGQLLHLEQRARVHAARHQGWRGGAQGAYRGGRTRQADADFHPAAARRSPSSPPGSCPIPSRCASCGRACSRAAA